MNIENIRLINFRNYKSLNLELNKKVNLFIGKNAQGKTNLLESIYMFAMGNSFRTNRDREIINFDKNEAYVAAKIYTGKFQKFIEIKMERDKPKRIRINKIELKNLRELHSGLNVVVFSPDDLRLVKEGPGERRSFLDLSVSQIRPVYKHNINRYNKILFQRNNLLKSKKTKSDIINLLDVFDLQLAKVGTEIIIARNEFIRKLSKISNKIHHNLTLGKENIELNYISNVDFNHQDKRIIENDFLEKLKANTNRELIIGTTEIGPHRDDIEIKINGIDARAFASQGQQRTIVLSIKLSEVEIIRIDKGSYPVLLLDDVFSELDEERRKYLIKSFNDMQTIITSTDIIDLKEMTKIDKSIFYIESGKIIQ